MESSALNVERSGAAGRAVFLSYASQDAEAAKRICDALRAAGVEVWFDQSELVGGDAWDAKIRKQIGSCALFVPIISAGTQARAEGYFRLEWKLADRRTDLIGKSKAFLLPVCIDDTRDSEADVPDSFSAVQWTRLRPAARDYGGQARPEGADPALAAFAAQVARLLAGQSATTATEKKVHLPAAPAAARKFNPLWLFILIPGAILFIATGGMMLKRYKDAGSAAQPSAPVSEAKNLAAKARALLDDDPLMTRANVQLAEQLSLQAIAKDQADAEAYAVAAWANFRYLETNYEDTPQRRADLRNYAEKARLLAPDSINAELASTGVLLATNNRAEAVSRLRALADRAPDNLTVLRAYAGAAPWGDGVNWGDDENTDPAALERLRAHSPLGRAYADSFLANQHWAKGEYVEADRVLDAIFAAGHPVRLSYLLRLLVLTYGWGDMPAARDSIAALPAKFLLEDVFITHVTMVFLYSGEHDRALATLDRTQREMLQEARIRLPAGMLRGEVLAAAGRPSAAAIQWRSALAVVDKWLGENPADPFLHLQRAYLLVRLDERKGAAAEFGLAMEMFNPPSGSVPWGRGYEYYAMIGDFENSIPRIDRLVARDNGRWPNDYNNLRYDPVFAGLRQDPRVHAIMARGAGWLAEMRRGTKPVEPKAVPSSVPDRKSVAALPFENRSASGEDAAFLADGIHEDLINTLSRVPGLKVMSRTAVERFRGAKTAMAEIVAALKVTHVVEAGVQRAGDQVRINVQLVQAGDGRTVWSERYDRTLSATNIFALQEGITAAIAQALQLRLEPGQETKLIAGTTRNLEAYEAFLKGRQIWKTPGISDREAVAQFQRAVELDPGFALAYGAMAEAYITLGNVGEELPSRVYPLAKAAAERALAIDPRCIQALTALGEYAFHYEWDWGKSEQLLRAALEVDPNYASVYDRLGGHMNMLNRPDEAALMEKKKLELEPDSPFTLLRSKLGAQLKAGDHPAAIATARQVAARVPGGFFGPYVVGSTLREAGQFPEAAQLLENAVRENPDSLRLALELGLTYAAAGQEARAREVMNRLGVIRGTRYVSPLIFARVAAALQDRDLAFAEIERAFQLHDSDLPGIARDDDLASLRGDPRFRDALHRLKLDAAFPLGGAK